MAVALDINNDAIPLGYKATQNIVIIWNEKKSNLKKVAQNWCEVNRGENFNEECLKVGGGDNKKWFKECVASAYFSPETLKGSIEGNKCWWRGYKNEA